MKSTLVGRNLMEDRERRREEKRSSKIGSILFHKEHILGIFMGTVCRYEKTQRILPLLLLFRSEQSGSSHKSRSYSSSHPK